MVLRSILFALFVYGVAAVISLLVVGIIRLLHKSVYRVRPEKEK
ncbi:MAG: hypothetical protein PHU08_02140 [Dehalococcoidales bacterium]|nr:hypothetical protein [Dehalococcoidales bacterium]